MCSTKKATGLPPHHPWDCTIDFLPGVTPPQSWIYPLSETRAMEEYVANALQQGLISQSTLLASTGFLFIEKKCGRLWPCIDYLGLNALTVKYKHSLPLVPVAFDQLHGSSVFTKLDLWSTYKIVCICTGTSGRPHLVLHQVNTTTM